MKNLYLFVFTFLLTGTLLAQKNNSNYDSKWFIGFNTGVTWSSSDIDNSFTIRDAEMAGLRAPQDGVCF